MATQGPAIVKASDGRVGTILEGRSTETDRDEAVTVLLDDGEQIVAARDSLAPQPDGSYRLELTARSRSQVQQTRDEVVVPVVAESIEVGKRTVETGRVRVRKTVSQVEQLVDEPVVHEEVEVVRVPINREIPEAIGPRQEGDTLIVPLLEEILVVEKRIVLREEVRITRRKVEKRTSQKVVLRSEQATVERVGGDDAPMGPIAAE